MPIEVHERDPFYSRFNVTCMNFVRSSPSPHEDCLLGPRQQVSERQQFIRIHLSVKYHPLHFNEQVNQITSFLDASNVYGSTEESLASLRLFKGGEAFQNFLFYLVLNCGAREGN